MHTRQHSHSGPHRQKGGIAVFAAIGIGVLVSMLALLDIGFMYHYKREYQKGADLAAMAGASQLHLGCGVAETRARAHAEQQLGQASRIGATTAFDCGQWQRGQTPPFTATDLDPNAVMVVVSGRPPRFFVPGTRIVMATGIALANDSIAALTIRSSVVSISSEQSALLNALVGNVLGGTLDLTVADWEALLHTDINLLTYMEALASEVEISAGNHAALLNESLSIGKLVDVALDVPKTGDESGQVDDALLAFLKVIGEVDDSPQVRIGDIFSIAIGTPNVGLDTALNVFELVQGAIRVAGRNDVIDIDLPNAAGLLNASLRLRMGDSGRVLDIGNPALEDVSVINSNARAIISLDLGAVSGLAEAIGQLVGGMLGPLMDFLGTVPGRIAELDLLGSVQAVLNAVSGIIDLGCGRVIPCEARNVIYIQFIPSRMDIAISLGDGKAEVDGYTCDSDSRSLDVIARTGAGSISVGVINGQDFFSRAAPELVVQSMPIMRIGYNRIRPRECSFSLLSGGECKGEILIESRVIASLGIRAQRAPIAASQHILRFSSDSVEGLPDFGEDPVYQSIHTQDIVASLRDTLGSLDFELRADSGFGGGVLSGTFSLIEGLLSSIQDELLEALAPQLDPLVDVLVASLGAQVAETQVGSNLSCGLGGGVLVQ